MTCCCFSNAVSDYTSTTFFYQCISKGLTDRMLSEVIHIMGSSSKIPHQVFMAAVVPSMILSSHIYEHNFTVQALS